MYGPSHDSKEDNVRGGGMNPVSRQHNWRKGMTEIEAQIERFDRDIDSIVMVRHARLVE